MSRLTPEEFQDALKKGLGRAVAHVRCSDPLELREPLLNASLTCLAYDAQCEESRAPWLMEMFQITGEPDFYRQPIFKRLWELADEEPRTGRNFWQLYHLTAEFALRGDRAARGLIYEVFDKTIHDETMEGCNVLLRLDGIEGLLYVLAKIGQRIQDGFGFQIARYDIESTEKEFGKEMVQAAIERETERNPLVQAYFERANSDDPYFDCPFCAEITMLPDLPLREWVDHIMDDGFSDFKDYGEDCLPYHCLYERRTALSSASRKADESEINYVIEKLIETDNPMRQFCLLGAFIRHSMPRVEKKILGFLDSDNDSLRWSTAIALSKTQHEMIRDKAMELLQSDSSRLNWDDGFDLLENNFLPGDQAVLEKAIQTREFQDIHRLHSAGLSLTTLIDRHPEESFHNLCCWFYERNPCSLCREDFVKHLVQHRTIPDEILAECRDDCNEETRQLVQETSAESA
jgi:hypothetical protein